jgi:cell wall-associated NlpC family hydrolase
LRSRLLILAVCCLVPAATALAAKLAVPARSAPKKPRTTARRRAVRPKPKPPSLFASLPQLSSYLLPPAPEPPRAPDQCVPCANRLLTTAYALLGVRYRRGGSSPDYGFDCSGFVKYVYQSNFPVSLPTSAPLQFQIGVPLLRGELEPGDLVFFRHRRRGWHVGMYVGDGLFIHAPNRRRTVSITPLDSPYFRTTYAGARRIPLSEPLAAVPTPASAGTND